MSLRCLATVVALCALSVPASPQEAVPPELQKRITLEHRGGFKAFVARLRTSIGINIMVDPRTREVVDPDAERELILRDVTAASALRWLTRLYGLDYAMQGDTLVIAQPGFLQAPVLRSHEIRPLLVRPTDTPGAVVSIPEGSPAGYFVVVRNGVKPNDLVGSEPLADLIKEFIAPGTWEGMRTLEIGPDQRLVVQHLPSVQKEIARFIETLGALAAPMVTVSAEIVEVDDASAALLRPGAATMIPAADVAKVLDLLQAGRRAPGARALQATSSATQRNQALVLDESSGVVGFSGKDPIVGQGIREVALLDCRPIPVRGGKYISVEARLTLGQATATAPLTVKGTNLTFSEGTLTHVATTFLVPNGGAALFALPGRSASSKRGQLCLFRASADAAPAPPAPAGRDQAGAAALAERLSKVPPAAADLEDATFDDFLKWFRAASGMNVVVDEEARKRRVTLHGKNLRMADVLTLVLQPEGLEWSLEDEAVYIAPRDRQRKTMELAMLDVRDVTYGLQFFPGAGQETPAQFTGEDLANFIKNTVRKDQWEEANGAGIQYDQGMILIRNTPEMIKRCIEFIDELRRGALRIVSMRADILTIPAEAADAILGRAGSESHLIDEKQYEALSRAGMFQERLGWSSFESQQTTMSWQRSQGYLRDWKGESPVLDAWPTQSSLTVRPILSSDGRSMVVELSYEDRRIQEVETKPVLDLMIQLPLSSHIYASTGVRIPEGRMALFKWSAPAKGEERRYRLLILKPTLAPEAK